MVVLSSHLDQRFRETGDIATQTWQLEFSPQEPNKGRRRANFAFGIFALVPTLSLSSSLSTPCKNKINFLEHFSCERLARSAFSLKMPRLVQWLRCSPLETELMMLLILLLSLPGPIVNLKLGCMVMLRKILVSNQVRVFKVIDILDYLKFKSI